MSTLADRNGDTYRCKVDSIEGGSVICLVNEKTRDEWICSVTCDNINQFWTLPSTQEDMIASMPCLAVGVLQDLLRRVRGNPWHSVSLIYKHSPYYMELQVNCRLSNSECSLPVQWSFPMVPKAPGDIQKQAAAKALEKSA